MYLLLFWYMHPYQNQSTGSTIHLNSLSRDNLDSFEKEKKNFDR